MVNAIFVISIHINPPIPTISIKFPSLTKYFNSKHLILILEILLVCRILHETQFFENFRLVVVNILRFQCCKYLINTEPVNKFNASTLKGTSNIIRCSSYYNNKDNGTLKSFICAMSFRNVSAAKNVRSSSLLH